MLSQSDFDDYASRARESRSLALRASEISVRTAHEQLAAAYEFLAGPGGREGTAPPESTLKAAALALIEEHSATMDRDPDRTVDRVATESADGLITPTLRAALDRWVNEGGSLG